MTQMTAFNRTIVDSLDRQLFNHPLYSAIQSLEDLRLFMDHHVYAVWDFMSLLKYLQQRAAPASFPWKPRGSASARFFINEIVLAEESDIGIPDAHGNPTYLSHFELYCDSMREVGADPSPAIRFAGVAADQSIDAAYSLNVAPPTARAFMESTFGFIASDKPHIVAAVFALGREHIIPEMFRSFLTKMHITAQKAPAFHYYLKRHIELDETTHAPLALKMVNEFIGSDTARLHEAEEAAYAAVESRIKLWDGVFLAIETRRQQRVPASSRQMDSMTGSQTA